MQNPYRTILPGPGPRDPGDKNEDSERRKKRRIHVACNNCRTRKVSCSGERPACSRCITENLTCQYVATYEKAMHVAAVNHQLEQLQKELQQHTDFIHRLKSAPESDVQVILRQLRSSQNVSNVLSSLKGAAHTAARLSDPETARAILPSTTSAVEFELGVLHQAIFPIVPPLEVDCIDTSKILQTVQPASPSGSYATDVQKILEGSFITSRPSPVRGTFAVRNPAIAGPLENPQYCDARLNQLKVGYWTKVPISDEFAASVLSHHLESYHAIFGCVDYDLFLSDLVGHKLEYCSPFLLAAILSLACQSYITFDTRSSKFVGLFLRDAKRLWKAERNLDSPKTLAGLCYLIIASGLYGDEELRFESTTEARAMAKRMALIDVRPSEELIAGFRRLPTNKIKELSYAAWGIYGALTYLASYFADMLPIEFAPCLPVPGNVSGSADSSKDIWLVFPLPVLMGRMFPALSALWIIVQGIRSMYFATDDTPIVDRVPLAFVESKYQELLVWVDDISKEVLRGEHSTEHILVFHGLYHCTLLFLLRPLQQHPQQQLRFRSFTSSDATPYNLYAASIKQLRRLMIAYSTTTPPLYAFAFFNSVLLEVAADLIQNPVKDAHWHFYFKACFEYWKHGYVRYRTIYAVLQALLASAMKSKVIDYDLASSLSKELRGVAPHYDVSSRAVSSAIMPFELEFAGTEKTSVEALATQFDELFLFHELIN